MITKVSGLNTDCVIKDPRRKSQRVQFKEYNNIPYKSSYYDDEYVQQRKDALWSSFFIVLGSIAFMVAYFLLTKKVAD